MLWSSSSRPSVPAFLLPGPVQPSALLLLPRRGLGQSLLERRSFPLLSLTLAAQFLDLLADGQCSLARLIPLLHRAFGAALEIHATSFEMVGTRVLLHPLRADFADFLGSRPLFALALLEGLLDRLQLSRQLRLVLRAHLFLGQAFGQDGLEFVLSARVPDVQQQTQAVTFVDVVAGTTGLDLQRTDLPLELLDAVTRTLEILLGAIELAQRFLASQSIATGAGRLLHQQPPLERAGVEDVVDPPLLHERVAADPQAGVEQ